MTDKLLAFGVPGYGNIGLPSQIQSVATIISNSTYGSPIISWGLIMAFVIAIITTLGYIIYGGWKWTTSGGDAKNVEGAQHIIIYAAVGLSLVLLSAFFVNVAASFFCVPLFGPLNPKLACP